MKSFLQAQKEREKHLCPCLLWILGIGDFPAAASGHGFFSDAYAQT
jgi:hypothetical protein